MRNGRSGSVTLGKRRRGAVRTGMPLRKRTKRIGRYVRRKQTTTGGDYLQFTTENRTMGRRISRGLKQRRLVSAARESVIYSFKALKSFDDNGYHFCSNNVAAGGMTGNNELPVYCLLLNGRTIGGSAAATPLLRMYIRNTGDEDGKLFWGACAGNVVSGTGTGTSELLQLEYMSSDPMPSGQRMHWDWSQVQFNLWGAKSKAVKWNIQICKVSDEDVNPWNYLADAETARVMPAEGQLAWLETVKQFVFNPLAKINVESVKSKIKVLKTWEKVIQPTTSIENDADPHAHVLKWFNRWNRNISFDKKILANGTVGLNNDVDLYQPKDIMSGIQKPFQWYPDDKDAVFIMIRASAYTHSSSPDGVTNNLYGSFDVSMRSKFTTLD